MESAEWKDKAIQRSVEIKRLKKTIKEVKIGKEKWKQKSIAHKSRADKLESDLKKVKEGLSKIVIRSL
jgi:hypothetical protein